MVKFRCKLAKMLVETIFISVFKGLFNNIGLETC
jgi:hypothetical protein